MFSEKSFQATEKKKRLSQKGSLFLFSLPAVENYENCKDHNFV
jgi:hypothetical protein